MIRSRALLGLLALAACHASVPEGKLACNGVDDCPSDWLCSMTERGGRCFSSAEAFAAHENGGDSGADGGGARNGDDGGLAGASGMSARDDGGAVAGGGSGSGGSDAGGDGGSAGASGSGEAGAQAGVGGGGSGEGGAAGEVVDPDTNECGDGVVETCGAGATDCDEVGGSHTCTCGLGYDGTDTTACTDTDECIGSNVCTADFPCVNRSPFYACRGQFADWPPEDSPSSDAFSVNGSGSNATVTDSRTGLEWEQTASASTFDWEGAKQHCSDLGNGFRLPTRAELESIIDFGHANPSIDTTAFPSTAGGFFWTSSPYVVDGISAWSVHFRYGNTYANLYTETLRARCVR